MAPKKAKRKDNHLSLESIVERIKHGERTFDILSALIQALLSTKPEYRDIRTLRIPSGRPLRDIDPLHVEAISQSIINCGGEMKVPHIPMICTFDGFVVSGYHRWHAVRGLSSNSAWKERLRELKKKEKDALTWRVLILPEAVCSDHNTIRNIGFFANSDGPSAAWSESRIDVLVALHRIYKLYTEENDMKFEDLDVASKWIESYSPYYNISTKELIRRLDREGSRSEARQYASKLITSSDVLLRYLQETHREFKNVTLVGFIESAAPLLNKCRQSSSYQVITEWILEEKPVLNLLQHMYPRSNWLQSERITIGQRALAESLFRVATIFVEYEAMRLSTKESRILKQATIDSQTEREVKERLGADIEELCLCFNGDKINLQPRDDDDGAPRWQGKPPTRKRASAFLTFLSKIYKERDGEDHPVYSKWKMALNPSLHRPSPDDRQQRKKRRTEPFPSSSSLVPTELTAIGENASAAEKESKTEAEADTAKSEAERDELQRQQLEESRPYRDEDKDQTEDIQVNEEKKQEKGGEMDQGRNEEQEVVLKEAAEEKKIEGKDVESDTAMETAGISSPTPHSPDQTPPSTPRNISPRGQPPRRSGRSPSQVADSKSSDNPSLSPPKYTPSPPRAQHPRSDDVTAQSKDESSHESKGNKERTPRSRARKESSTPPAPAKRASDRERNVRFSPSNREHRRIDDLPLDDRIFKVSFGRGPFMLATSKDYFVANYPHPSSDGKGRVLVPLGSMKKLSVAELCGLSDILVDQSISEAWYYDFLVQPTRSQWFVIPYKQLHILWRFGDTFEGKPREIMVECLHISEDDPVEQCLLNLLHWALNPSSTSDAQSSLSTIETVAAFNDVLRFLYDPPMEKVTVTSLSPFKPGIDLDGSCTLFRIETNPDFVAPQGIILLGYAPFESSSVRSNQMFRMGTTIVEAIMDILPRDILTMDHNMKRSLKAFLHKFSAIPSITLPRQYRNNSVLHGLNDEHWISEGKSVHPWHRVLGYPDQFFQIDFATSLHTEDFTPTLLSQESPETPFIEVLGRLKPSKVLRAGRRFLRGDIIFDNVVKTFSLLPPILPRQGTVILINFLLFNPLADAGYSLNSERGKSAFIYAAIKDWATKLGVVKVSTSRSTTIVTPTSLPSPTTAFSSTGPSNAQLIFCNGPVAKRWKISVVAVEEIKGGEPIILDISQFGEGNRVQILRGCIEYYCSLVLGREEENLRNHLLAWRQGDEKEEEENDFQDPEAAIAWNGLEDGLTVRLSGTEPYGLLANRRIYNMELITCILGEITLADTRHRCLTGTYYTCRNTVPEILMEATTFRSLGAYVRCVGDFSDNLQPNARLEEKVISGIRQIAMIATKTIEKDEEIRLDQALHGNLTVDNEQEMAEENSGDHGADSALQN